MEDSLEDGRLTVRKGSLTKSKLAWGLKARGSSGNGEEKLARDSDWLNTEGERKKEVKEESQACSLNVKVDKKCRRMTHGRMRMDDIKSEV